MPTSRNEAELEKRLAGLRGEGESKDTPDRFLHEGLDELFAEYYTRNLSVMIRDGMSKNAQMRKASGVRIFGYKVNADNRFEIDEETAPAVRHVFTAYANGQSVNELANWLNAKGYKTVRGNPWRPKAVGKMLKRDSYMGVYRFNGVVDAENGMPAIIDKGLYMEVQGIMEARAKTRCRRTETDFLLTGKLFHLDDGLPMSGASGTGKSGAIDEAEARMEELDMLIARERFNKTNLLNPGTVRGYVGKIIGRIDRDPTGFRGS